MKPIAWSCGGGTQSAAIAVLIAQGKLPKPDVALIADTSREASETWDYLEKHIQPLVKVEMVPHSYATVDLYGGNGDILIPAFTRDGKLPTFCSNEWKQRPVARRLKELGYGPKNPVVLWLGISVDEAHRIKPSRTSWIEHQWPLCDLFLRRWECVELVEKFGLPAPPRSSCWMCPHRSNEEWLHLYENWNSDWSKAVALDREIRERDSEHELYLHTQRVPLDEAYLKGKESKLDGCDGGFCFV